MQGILQDKVCIEDGIAFSHLDKYVHCITVLEAILHVFRFKQNCLSKIVIIFLPINSNMCFGAQKNPSSLDGSFEYMYSQSHNIFYVLAEKYEGVDRGGGRGTGIEGAGSGVEGAESGVEGAGSGSRGGGKRGHCGRGTGKIGGRNCFFC